MGLIELQSKCASFKQRLQQREPIWNHRSARDIRPLYWESLQHPLLRSGDRSDKDLVREQLAIPTLTHTQPVCWRQTFHSGEFHSCRPKRCGQSDSS